MALRVSLTAEALHELLLLLADRQQVRELTDARLAEQFGVSERTVRRYARLIKRKAGVRTCVSLATG